MCSRCALVLRWHIDCHRHNLQLPQSGLHAIRGRHQPGHHKLVQYAPIMCAVCDVLQSILLLSRDGYPMRAMRALMIGVVVVQIT